VTKVERRFHRLTVALPKERLDVLLEADRLVGCGQVTSSPWILTGQHANAEESQNAGPTGAIPAIAIF
jgi:hypothetical protein